MKPQFITSSRALFPNKVGLLGSGKDMNLRKTSSNSVHPVLLFVPFCRTSHILICLSRVPHWYLTVPLKCKLHENRVLACPAHVSQILAQFLACGSHSINVCCEEKGKGRKEGRKQVSWLNIFKTVHGNQERVDAQDFPGSLVVETLPSQCRGAGFNPWSGN